MQASKELTTNHWLATAGRLWKRVAQRQLRIGEMRPWGLYGWIAVAFLVTFFAYIARLQPVTHDAFHEMSLVREWIVSGDFPQDDVFAFSPTVSPSVHHEWATGLILYFATANEFIGLQGMMVLKIALVIALWLLLYRVARGHGAHPIVFFCTSFIVFPMLWVGFATVRAQLFTLVFLAAQLLMQQADWRGSKRWFLLWIPMMLLWLNVHAGFVVGLGMIGFHSFERFSYAFLKHLSRDAVCDAHSRSLHSIWKRICSKSPVDLWCISLHSARDIWHLMLTVPVVGILALANPWGVDYLPYLFDAIRMPRPTMLEWKPLWHTYQPGLTLCAWIASVGLAFYCLRHRRMGRLRGFLFCMLAAYMALKHIRHGSLYAVVWIGLVPAWLSATPLGIHLRRFVSSHHYGFRRVAQYVAIGAILFCIANESWRATIPQSFDDVSHPYPVAAIDFLESKHFEGKIVVPFHTGAFVTWRLFPKALVSIDGRYEVAYQPDVLPKHNLLYAFEDGWQDVLNEYSPDALLVPKNCELFRNIHVLLQKEVIRYTSATDGNQATIDGQPTINGQPTVNGQATSDRNRNSSPTFTKLFEDDSFVLLQAR